MIGVGTLAAMIVILLTGLAGTAAGFQCPDGIVTTGDTKIVVMQKCGKPDYQEVIGLRKIGSDVIKVEQWYYDFGRNEFSKILTFQGGVLVEIENGGWGRKP